MASNDELADICSSFILAAPPGELYEVVSDVRALLDDESILNKVAGNTFRQYNQEQMIVVDSPGNAHKVLITEQGETSPGKYLDPKGQQIILFDHIKQAVSGKAAIGSALDSGIEVMRKAFEDAAFAYVDDHFNPDGATTVYGKGKVVTIAIQSSKYNPSNFWNGRFRSLWTCDVSGSEVVIEGVIKTQVHFYESGNVQLQTVTKKAAKVPKTNPADTAKAALDAIKKIDAAFMKSLGIQYSTMDSTTYKALRRALPITRAKVDWRRIAAMKMANAK